MKYIFIFALLCSVRAGAEQAIAEPASVTNANADVFTKCVGGGEGCPKDHVDVNFNEYPAKDQEQGDKRLEEYYGKPGVVHPNQIKDGKATKEWNL